MDDAFPVLEEVPYADLNLKETKGGASKLGNFWHTNVFSIRRVRGEEWLQKANNDSNGKKISSQRIRIKVRRLEETNS